MNIRILLAAMIPLVSATSTSMARTPAKISDVAGFLAASVAGRKFTSESRGFLPSGPRYDFSQTRVINNVTRNGETVTFDWDWGSRETIFELLTDGEYSTIPVTRNRLGSSTCEVAGMKSTGELTGHCRIIRGRGAGVPTHGFSRVKVKFEDGRLTIVVTTSGYADSLVANDTFAPGRFEVTSVFWKDAGGRTILEETKKSWTVDPENLEPMSKAHVEGPEVVIAR